MAGTIKSFRYIAIAEVVAFRFCVRYLTGRPPLTIREFEVKHIVRSLIQTVLYCPNFESGQMNTANSLCLSLYSSLISKESFIFITGPRTGSPKIFY